MEVFVEHPLALPGSVNAKIFWSYFCILWLPRGSEEIAKRLQMWLNNPQCGYKEGEKFPIFLWDNYQGKSSHIYADIATTTPNRPSGPIRWKVGMYMTCGLRSVFWCFLEPPKYIKMMDKNFVIYKGAKICEKISKGNVTSNPCNPHPPPHASVEKVPL